MENRKIIEKIVNSDKFLGIDLVDQALFFHLVFRMDKNGEISNPIAVTRMVGIPEAGIEYLIDMGFLIRGFGCLSLPVWALL